MFQGRAEFIEKYFETVRELRARGFAVATLDWRGQGLSERALDDPRKGTSKTFPQYERDLDVFMNEVVLPDCPPPHFAIAHSMGGAVMMNIVEEGLALVRPHRHFGADDRTRRYVGLIAVQDERAGYALRRHGHVLHSGR